MGGFAALIGGMGSAARQYGDQVRGFLENRRTNLVDTMLNLAAQEPDEQLRGEYLGHASKLLSGEPMAKMIPAIGKTVQGHLESSNTMAQLFPPPGGPATGPGQAVGVQPGQPVIKPETPPPSAAMYPTSPVNPLAQGGQEAAGLSPMIQAPGPATQSPFAFAPNAANIPGTTLPEGSAPQARMSAIPPINPYTEAPQDMEQAGAAPQSYVDRILQHPYMRTPAGRAILAQPLANAAEMDRQLGVAYVQMGWRRQQAEPAIAEMDKVLNNPASSSFERMAARSAKIQTTEWIAGGGAAPAFPLTASNLIQLNRGRVQSVDVTNMPPDVKGFYGIPESAVGAQLLSTDPMSNQIREGGWVGQASPQMRPETVWDQATRSFQQMAVDIAHPGEGPLGFGDQGGRYQFPPPGFARQPIVNLVGGGRAYGPSQFDVQQERIRQGAIQGGILTAGVPTPIPELGVNYAGVPQYRTTTQEVTESGGKTSSTSYRGAPGAPQPAPPAPRGTQPIQPPGGENTPPSTTGAPAPIAKIPGVNYDQVAAAVAQVTRPNLSIAESKALEEKLGVSSTGALAKTPFARAYRQMIRQKAIDDPNNLMTWDAPIAAMAQRSTQTLNEITRLEGVIARMKQNGELGPLASRWNEFLTNHLGEDLSQNHDYVALANGLDLLSTALGFVHGGARGGGSIQMKESFQKHLNVARMDADTLLGAIGEEKNWLLGYANPSLNNLEHLNLPAGTGPAQGGYQIGDMYGNQEYLGGDPRQQSNWRQH